MTYEREQELRERCARGAVSVSELTREIKAAVDRAGWYVERSHWKSAEEEYRLAADLSLAARQHDNETFDNPSGSRLNLQGIDPATGRLRLDEPQWAKSKWVAK